MYRSKDKEFKELSAENHLLKKVKFKEKRFF